MNNNLLILGAGGHGRVVKETAEELGCFGRICFLDDRPDSGAIGMSYQSGDFFNEFSYAFAAVGNNDLRMKWLTLLESQGYTIPVLIHPRAMVSNSVSVEAGTIICIGAIVNTNSVIGKGCIISPGAIVDHDVIIKSGVHVSDGAIVKSDVVIPHQFTVASDQIINRNTTLFDDLG